MLPPANSASGNLVLTQRPCWRPSSPLDRQRCKLKLAGGLCSLLGGPAFLGQLLNFFELLFVYTVRQRVLGPSTVPRSRRCRM